MQNTLKISLIILSALFISAYIAYFSFSIVFAAIILVFLLGVISIWVPGIIFAAFLLGTIIIPEEILSAISGTNEAYGFGMMRLHPAGTVVFLGAFFYLVFNSNRLIKKMSENKILIIITALMGIFFVLTASQTFLFRGVRGMPQCLENYLFPLTFFLYLVLLDKETAVKMLKAYTSVLILIVIYGLFEYAAKFNFLYDGLYKNSFLDWYGIISNEGYRVTTTVGHPLKNATYFLAGLALSLRLFKKPYNIIFPALFFLGILTTGSRIGLILAAFCYCLNYIEFNFNPKKIVKTLVIFFSLSAFFIGAMKFSPFSETLKYRIEGSHESALIRIYSIQNLLNVAKDNFFTGKGMGACMDESAQLFNRGIGFENPWIMLIADAGLAGAAIYFSVLMLIIFSNLVYLQYSDIRKGIYVCLASFLLMTASYNSFGTKDMANFLLWFIIALLYIFSAKGTERDLKNESIIS